MLLVLAPWGTGGLLVRVPVDMRMRERDGPRDAGGLSRSQATATTGCVQCVVSLWLSLCPGLALHSCQRAGTPHAARAPSATGVHARAIGCSRSSIMASGGPWCSETSHWPKKRGASHVLHLAGRRPVPFLHDRLRPTLATG